MKAHIVIKMFHNGQRYNEQVFSSRQKAKDEIKRIAQVYVADDNYIMEEWEDEYFGWMGVKLTNPNGRKENDMVYFVESLEIK